MPMPRCFRGSVVVLFKSSSPVMTLQACAGQADRDWKPDMLRPLRFQGHYRIWSALLSAAALHLLLFLVLIDWRFYEQNHEARERVVVVDIVRLEPLVVEEKAGGLARRPVPGRPAALENQASRQDRDQAAKIPAAGGGMLERSGPAAAVTRQQGETGNPLSAQDQAPTPAEPGPSAINRTTAAKISEPAAAVAIKEARPLYKENPPPAYPSLARRRGYQGTVEMDVLVDRQGRAAASRVFRSSGFQLLDEAAEKAVNSWRFTPAVHGDEKVDMWVRVPVRFQLK